MGVMIPPNIKFLEALSGLYAAVDKTKGRQRTVSGDYWADWDWNEANELGPLSGTPVTHVMIAMGTVDGKVSQANHGDRP